jgi:hypothetical protein
MRAALAHSLAHRSVFRLWKAENETIPKACKAVYTGSIPVGAFRLPKTEIRDGWRVTGSDKEILGRSVATLVESWAYLASGSPGAEVTRIEDGAIAAFPQPPDRDFLNNAVLARRPADIAATVARVEVAYARVGVERFAIWVHETEPATAEELRGRGYRLDTSTRTMAMSTADLAAFDSPPSASRRSMSSSRVWRSFGPSMVSTGWCRLWTRARPTSTLAGSTTGTWRC